MRKTFRVHDDNFFLVFAILVIVYDYKIRSERYIF